MYIGQRKCGHCGLSLEIGEEIVQISVDSPHTGFTYNHKKCVDFALSWTYTVTEEGVIKHIDLADLEID